MLTATSKINMQESKDYFCTIYKIKYNDKYKREWEVKKDFSETNPPVFVRTAYDFDDKSKCVKSIELDDEYRILPLPYIPLKSEQERSTIYISGASGKGKSYLINEISEMYHALFPNNKLYFFTKNDWTEDRSLNKDLYEFVDVDKFIEHYRTADMLKQFLLTKEFNNSFFIFDDIGALEKISKEAAHTLQTVIDIILENKRKAKVSIAILSHIPTNYKKTSLLIREMKQYYLFPGNLQAKSDRIIDTYLGLSKKEIERIVDEDSVDTTWLCVDNERRIIFTQRQIYFLKSKKLEKKKPAKSRKRKNN